jgi:hypothetical protein
MGHSEGVGGPRVRGYFFSIQELVEDIIRLLVLVRREVGDSTELFVHGSCFGGCLLIKALLSGVQDDEYIRLKGVVLQSPLTRVDPETLNSPWNRGEHTYTVPFDPLFFCPPTHTDHFSHTHTAPLMPLSLPS